MEFTEDLHLTTCRPRDTGIHSRLQDYHSFHMLALAVDGLIEYDGCVLSVCSNRRLDT